MGLFDRLRAVLGKRQSAPAPPLLEAEERDYARSELRAFDGRDEKTPVLIAVRGEVFDVTRGRAFYGPGGPYGAFAGHDCTLALAKMSLDPEDLDAPVRDLSPDEEEKLEDWIDTFRGKYRSVGKLIDD